MRTLDRHRDGGGRVAFPVVVSVAAAQPQSPLTELVDATARRLEVAEPVALAKFGNGQPVKDPQREQQVIDTVIAEATTLGADPAVVATVFRDQIDASVAIQYARMSQWTLDPATVPATAGDLAASRAVLDAVNREMVTRLVEQRGVLTSPLCAVELDRAGPPSPRPARSTRCTGGRSRSPPATTAADVESCVTI